MQEPLFAASVSGDSWLGPFERSAHDDAHDEHISFFWRVWRRARRAQIQRAAQS